MKNEFQDRLQDFLIEKDMSRLELAKKINVNPETINGYFNDNLYPDIKIAKRIADFFGCSLDYLLGLTEQFNNKEKNNLSFIDTIKKLLKENHKSVEKAMKEMNINESTYYRWQRGSVPHTSVLITLAKYFDVSVDYLSAGLIK